MKWKLIKFAVLCYGTYKLLSIALVRKMLWVALKHEGQKLLPR